MTEVTHNAATSRIFQARHFDRADRLYVCVLFAITLISRISNRGSLYFVDGPRLVRAISIHTYVIQPPGYWVYAHLGGLFRDPATGLAFWNILFSALGVGVFYLLCRSLQSQRALCFVSAICFGSLYFVWFAGEIHSSYASQILFPPLGLFCFQQYRRTSNEWWSYAWTCSFGCSMALRPSDGTFLLPLMTYLLWRYVPNRTTWVRCACLLVVIFLAWYFPTKLALSETHRLSTGATLLIQMRMVSPLLTGINGRSLANILRVVCPLLFAFWAMIPAISVARDSSENKIVLLWVTPGLLFFLLCYIADPTYLIFLSGACFWLVLTSRNTRRAMTCLVVCTVFNAGLFLGARPVHRFGSAGQIYNFYVVKYCRYGITHRWSSNLGDRKPAP